MKGTSGRYEKQQKASDTQYRRAIRAYARGLPPSQAIACKDVTHRPKLSLPTLYRIYAQLRLRLVEAGYYRLTTLGVTDNTNPDNNRPASGFHDLYGTEDWDRMEKIVRQRRGVTAKSLPYHQAEIFQRMLYMAPTEWEFVSDIENIIRITGPLNAPLRNIEKVTHFIHVGRFTRRIAVMRKDQAKKPDDRMMVQVLLDIWLQSLPRLADERRYRRGMQRYYADPRNWV